MNYECTTGRPAHRMSNPITVVVYSLSLLHIEWFTSWIISNENSNDQRKRRKGQIDLVISPDISQCIIVQAPYFILLFFSYPAFSTRPDGRWLYKLDYVQYHNHRRTGPYRVFARQFNRLLRRLAYCPRFTC